jgi:hypothetical protein
VVANHQDAKATEERSIDAEHEQRHHSSDENKAPVPLLHDP